MICSKVSSSEKMQLYVISNVSYRALQHISFTYQENTFENLRLLEV